MYSIAKLLSDEPKKLESLILAVLKLLSTIWIANLFLGFNPDLSTFSIQSFFQNFKVYQSIYFVLTSIGVWYLLWDILIELVVEFIIKLFSLIGDPEDTLNWYLSITGSIKTKKDQIIDTKPGILFFTEIIKDENQDYPFIVETRANQIFSVGLVSFIILMTSELELSSWQQCVGIFIIINFFIVSIFQRKLHDYYKKNADLIRSKYYPLGQLQKVKDVISQIEPLKNKYELKVIHKRIELNSQSEFSFLPKQIFVLPLYCFNSDLGAYATRSIISKIEKKLQDNQLVIICSNFYSSEKQLSKIKDNIFCVSGESHSDIFKGFEELIYRLKIEGRAKVLNPNSEQLDG